MNMLRYWNRLVKMSDDRLTKKIFIYDYEQSRNGCRNWCSDVECILDDINKFEPYLDKSECLLEEAQNRLSRNCEEIWLEKCRNMPKLRTYILLKSSLKTEEYLTTFMTRSKRSLFAQLRFGILPIRIETGRFKNIRDAESGQYRKLKPDERLCEICMSNEIENEIHFVCRCDR